MSHLTPYAERLELTALSLLPIWWWRDVSERLRAGGAPGRIFDEFLAERWSDRPETPAAVLGSGADVIYPSEHRALAREIEPNGAILSELVPGTPPQKQFFPRRNRIISGLSRAVVVIEAGEKSGSLITARCALEQGRDVLAVPGNLLSGRSRGAHALLRDGAKIMES